MRDVVMIWAPLETLIEVCFDPSPVFLHFLKQELEAADIQRHLRAGVIPGLAGRRIPGLSVLLGNRLFPA